MAVVISDSAVATSATTSCTVTTSGTNRAIVAIVTEDVATPQDFTLTVDGNTMGSPLIESTGTGQYVAIYYLADPSAAGAKVVDSSGGSGASFIGAWALENVDISGTPHDTALLEESGTGTVATGDAISSAAGDLVLGVMSANGNVPVGNAAALGTNQTNDEVVDAAGGATVAMSNTPGTASVTQSWGTFGGNRRWSVISVNINAVAAGTIVPLLNHLRQMKS